MPRDPDAQMAPEIIRLSYFFSSITGMPIKPSMMMEAAITPTQAAKMVPMMMTAMVKPPGTFPINMYRVSNMRLAIPVFSTMLPMKMKRGMAMNPWEVHRLYMPMRKISRTPGPTSKRPTAADRAARAKPMGRPMRIVNSTPPAHDYGDDFRRQFPGQHQ